MREFWVVFLRDPNISQSELVIQEKENSGG